MMVIVVLFIVSLCFVQGRVLLRNHHYRMQSPVDQTVSHGSQVMAYPTTHNVCGEASLTCMAFTPSTVPIRCGVLEKAHVCNRQDPVTQQTRCDVFCDTDGGGRLCQEAFPACCRNSMHGCISSKPRHVVYN